jgi:hypothetical protein
VAAAAVPFLRPEVVTIGTKHCSNQQGKTDAYGTDLNIVLDSPPDFTLIWKTRNTRKSIGYLNRERTVQR